MKILVVDDEPSYKLFVRDVLMAAGWDVLMAENGDEAMTKLKYIKVDVIVSDIYMPVMDGIKFHRAVRANPDLAKIPFLFVSAFDDQFTLEAVRDPRYDAFFRKTGQVDHLLEWIEFLSTPEENRPKVPPGTTRSSINLPRGTGNRGGTSTPTL